MLLQHQNNVADTIAAVLAVLSEKSHTLQYENPNLLNQPRCGRQLSVQELVPWGLTFCTHQTASKEKKIHTLIELKADTGMSLRAGYRRICRLKFQQSTNT